MKKDVYLLVANHLRDIHHALEEKILASRTFSPKWETQKIDPETEMVVELSSLLGIVVLLEKLASSGEREQVTMMSPGVEEE